MMDKPKGNPMIDRRDWKEFQESGMLWWINRIIHTFGYSIVLEIDTNNKVVGAYPARVAYRGFSEKVENEGYSNVSRYMRNNAEDLVEETL